MGVLSAVNCLLITLGPLYIVALTQRLAFRSLSIGASVHLASQATRLILLAAVPIHLLGDESERNDDLVATALMAIDALLLYVTFTTFRKFLNAEDPRGNVLAVGTGWTIAECLLTRVVPIYVKAVDIGFSYDLYMLCLQSNMNLPRNIALAGMCSVFARSRRPTYTGAIAFAAVALALWACKHVVAVTAMLLVISGVINVALFVAQKQSS